MNISLSLAVEVCLEFMTIRKRDNYITSSNFNHLHNARDVRTY